MVTTITAIGVSAVGVIADVSPNSTGLPGISTLSNMVGALLTVGLIACVAGLVHRRHCLGHRLAQLQPAFGGPRQVRRSGGLCRRGVDRWRQRPGRFLRCHRQGNLGLASRKADLMRKLWTLHRRLFVAVIVVAGPWRLECAGIGRQS